MSESKLLETSGQLFGKYSEQHRHIKEWDYPSSKPFKAITEVNLTCPKGCRHRSGEVCETLYKTVEFEGETLQPYKEPYGCSFLTLCIPENSIERFETCAERDRFNRDNKVKYILRNVYFDAGRFLAMREDGQDNFEITVTGGI